MSLDFSDDFFKDNDIDTTILLTMIRRRYHTEPLGNDTKYLIYNNKSHKLGDDGLVHPIIFYNENEDYGDLFTIAQFEDSVDCGAITDYDGQGYWANSTHHSDTSCFETPPIGATHVIWYNK